MADSEEAIIEKAKHRLLCASTREETWQAALEYARLQPFLFIGDGQKAHRYAIRALLKLGAVTGAFPKPRNYRVGLTDYEYAVLIDSNPLRNEIADLIDWRSYTLLNAFNALGWQIRRMPEMKQSWSKYFRSASGPELSTVMLPVYLAKTFLICIKTAQGCWVQCFIEGLPTKLPQLVQIDTKVGILVYGQLSPVWFTGLPFNAHEFSQLVSKGMPVVHAHFYDDRSLLSLKDIQSEDWVQIIKKLEAVVV